MQAEQEPTKEKTTRRPKNTGSVQWRNGQWYIRYVDARGRRRNEPSGKVNKTDAEKVLRARLKAKDEGVPTGPDIGKIRFPEAAKNFVTDYQIKGRRSIAVARRRIEKHLAPYFGNMLMTAITTAEVRDYIKKRQNDTVLVRKERRWRLTPISKWHFEPEVRRPVSPAEINRGLTTLKRMVSLAIEDGFLLYKPKIPMLREDNVRTGFFEPDQFAAVCAHLPEEIQPIVKFAYITGWRITSEILPLEWRRVDFLAEEVRLDTGTTKNRKPRVIKMTDDLRALLIARQVEHERVKKAGHICPFVFFREVADERGGEKKPRQVKAFTKSWKIACQEAGCPGRIPHDLRRTAVRNMVRRGIPEGVAMKWTGHTTRSIFDRYNIVREGDMMAAAERLSGLLGSSVAVARRG